MDFDFNIQPSGEEKQHANSGKQVPQQHFVLTARQYEVLRQMHRGNTNKGIASVIKRSKQTVDIEIGIIYFYLGVHDRGAAVGECWKRGILNMNNC